MVNFIVVRAVNYNTLDAVKDNLRKLGLSVVSIWPDKIFCKTFNECNTFLLILQNSKSCGFIKSNYFCIDESIFLFSGMPYFENLDSANYARSFYSHNCKYADQSDFLANTYGNWCKCWVSPKGTYGLTDFTGMSPLYYLETSDFAAVSNRQFLLGAARDGARINIDLLASTWLTGQANLFGENMLVEGVKHVPPGSSFRINHTIPSPCVIVGENTIWNDQSLLEDDISDREGNEIVTTLVQQMNCMALLPMKSIKLDITGGLDSRCILALALASDMKNKIDVLSTGGKIGSREIEIGSRIADMVSIPHKKSYAKVEDYSFNSILKQIRSQVFRYEGMLCPTDAFSPEARLSTLNVSGSAGEIYRRHCKPHMNVIFTTKEQLLQAYGSYHQQTDPLNIQKKNVSTYQGNVLRYYAEKYYDEHIDMNDISDIFFLKFRLPHWNGVIFSNVWRSVRLTPLANYNVARMAFRKKFNLRISDRYHFEILSRLHPELAAHPFLDNKWSAHVRQVAAAKNIQVATEPFHSTEKKSLADIIPIGYFLHHKYLKDSRHYMTSVQTPSIEKIYDMDAIGSILSGSVQIPQNISSIKAFCSLISTFCFHASNHIHAVEGDVSTPISLDGEAEDFFAGIDISHAGASSLGITFVFPS